HAHFAGERGSREAFRPLAPENGHGGIDDGGSRVPAAHAARLKLTDRSVKFNRGGNIPFSPWVGPGTFPLPHRVGGGGEAKPRRRGRERAATAICNRPPRRWRGGQTSGGKATFQGPAPPRPRRGEGP